MRSMQLWVIICLLAATLVTVHLRGDVDRVPPSEPLATLPTHLGEWTGQDVPISPETLEILGKGDFLNRVYLNQTGVNRAGSAAVLPIQLFVAYFPTQRSGQSIHSPQNCLPGSGWTFLQSGVTSFRDRTGNAYRVGEYVISNGRDRQEVLYWYQSHGRSIASDYMAKLLMLADSIRLGRTDAALVRVITPFVPGDTQQSAHQRAVGFAQNVTPLLPAYVPN